MWLFAPVFLLFFASLIIFILQQVKPRPGVAWSITIVSGLISWVILLIMRWIPPSPVIFNGWMANNFVPSSISFQMDLISWPYAFSLGALLLAVIISSATRLNAPLNPAAWSGCLLITGLGLMAVMAGNALTILLAWTFLDLVELAIMMGSVKSESSVRSAVLSFSIKVFGSMVLIYAIILSQSLGEVLVFNKVLPEVGVFLLIAAGLRLGVIPRHLPLFGDNELRRDLGMIIRLAGPSSTLVLLGRLPGALIPDRLYPFLMLVIVLGCLYSSFMWLNSKDELSGRPYWLITIAGLAVACVLKGMASSSIAWGVVLILSGGLIFLYSSHNPILYFLPLLGLVGLSGLPFTPASSAWFGLTANFDFASAILLLSVVVLMGGYYRHAFALGEPFSALERWAQFVYPIGLSFLMLTLWIIGVAGWPGSFLLGRWWVSIPVNILLVGIAFLLRRYRFGRQEENPLKSWHQEIGLRVASPIANFFSLNWMITLITYIYRGINYFVSFLSEILEGDGGVLWALVILAFMATTLIPGGQ